MEFACLSFNIPCPRWDGFRNNTIPAELMTARALRGELFPQGTVVMLVQMLEFKKHLLSEGWK